MLRFNRNGKNAKFPVMLATYSIVDSFKLSHDRLINIIHNILLFFALLYCPHPVDWGGGEGGDDLCDVSPCMLC